jgi:anti-anti-sigma factor
VATEILNRNGDMLTAAPQGRLAKEEADWLCDQIKPLLAEGVKRLMLDLSEVDYMTSSALGVIILLLQRVRSGGGKMAVAAPGERIHLLLEVAGLNQLLELCRTRAEAKNYLLEGSEEA